MRNFLEKESNKPDFPIKLQMLDVRNMDYNPDRRNRRLEPCVSLRVRIVQSQFRVRDTRG